MPLRLELCHRMLGVQKGGAAVETTELWRYIEAWRARQPFSVSQAELARKMGVRPTALSQWKAGKTRPTPANLRRLSTVTGVSYEILLDALLIDMGYRQEQRHGTPQEGTPNTQAAGSAAPNNDNVVDLPTAAHPMTGAQSAGRRQARDQDEQGES